MKLKKVYEEINRLEIYKTDESLTEHGEQLLNELKYLTKLTSNTKSIGVVIPHSLIDENGLEELLIGKFHETIVCHDDEGEPYEVKMPVELDTIKKIYSKIVEYYGSKY